MEKYARLSLLTCLWLATLAYGAALVYVVVNPQRDSGPLLMVSAYFIVFLCALIPSLRGKSLVHELFPSKKAQSRIADWSERIGIASFWFVTLGIILMTAVAALEIRADPWPFISLAGMAIIFALMMVGVHARRWIDRRMPGHGICPKCLYDLSATPNADVCPECGEPIDHEFVFGRPKPEEEEV